MTDLITRDPSDTGEIARPLADRASKVLVGEATQDLSGRTSYVITDAAEQTAVLPMPPTVGVYERMELAIGTDNLFRTEPPPLRTADPAAETQTMPQRLGVTLPETRTDLALPRPMPPTIPPPPRPTEPNPPTPPPPPYGCVELDDRPYPPVPPPPPPPTRHALGRRPAEETVRPEVERSRGRFYRGRRRRESPYGWAVLGGGVLLLIEAAIIGGTTLAGVRWW